MIEQIYCSMLFGIMRVTIVPHIMPHTIENSIDKNTFIGDSDQSVRNIKYMIIAMISGVINLCVMFIAEDVGKIRKTIDSIFVKRLPDIIL